MNAPGRVRLAVLGSPLTYTRSPELHCAGMTALGIECTSEALPTTIEELGARLSDLAARGGLGCNLTHPLKHAAFAHVDRASVVAARAQSINTIGWTDAAFPLGWGDSTDGGGFADWITTLGRPLAGGRLVLLGAGGAARSIALAVIERGAAVTVSARTAARPEWSEVQGVRWVTWRSDDEARAVDEATWLAQCTPLEDPAAIFDPARVPAATVAVDLRYGPAPTPWVLSARARGVEAWDGLGMLVHQARRAIQLWAGDLPPLAPLERAVGWPR